MVIDMPSLEQVRELPVLLTGTVLESFIDVNGHMNIRHYLDHGAEGANQVVIAAGVDDAYRADMRMGVFTVEHHLCYVGEMRLDDRFTVHTRVLHRTEKVLHLMSFIVDETRERLANTLEITLVHVDIDSRSAKPFPDNVATRLDAMVAEHADLLWDAPLSGVMGPRG